MRRELWAVGCLLASAALAQVYAQDQPPQPATERICAVSDDRFKRAQAIFAKIAEVLRQPRCINCHGAENPFRNGTEHTGGTYELKMDKNGEVDVKATFDACQQCHGALPDWRIPTSDMYFIHLDDTGLCKLIKDQLVRGDDLINHFTRDRGGTPFIEEAFKGTRGLKGQGVDMVDDNPVPIRIITQQGLINLAKDWIDALGSGNGTIGDGDLRAPTDCGCVQHHYALKLAVSVRINSSAEHLTIRNGDDDPPIPIVFNDDRSFKSKPVRTTSLGAGSVGSCGLTSSASGDAGVSGTLDDVGDTLHAKIWAGAVVARNTWTGVCASSSGTNSIAAPKIVPIGEFTLGPNVGTTSILVPVPNMKDRPGYSGGATITIVKVD
jgi:hypothetical protein